jgi:UPF0716 protein FxsA
MRFMLLAILLAFPVLDLLVTLRLARWTGVPVWGWLAAGVGGGFLLLRNERDAFRANITASLHGGQPLLRGLIDSGRKVLAGFLLLLPGLVSDLVALVLLALPLNMTGALGAAAMGRMTSARRGAIDGEYRRIE